MSILVGRKAPDFTSDAVLANGTIVGDFNLSKTLEGKYGVLFFYPMDFTFVCPTEIVALSHRTEALAALNTQVIGVSIDSHHTHFAYRNTSTDNGGIGPVKYPLVADLDHSISRAYGIEVNGGESYYPNGVSMRATFVIDANGIVRHQVVNDEPLGRNMDEVVRIVEALQYFEKNGQVCPAGWTKDKSGFSGTAAGVAAYMKDNAGNL
ncbi:MAG: peroxiredoxin [Myxococcota bacterium]|nr:peroxiredoxin [Myxococcota bacterium]